jgi:hypothetical protein
VQYVRGVGPRYYVLSPRCVRYKTDDLNSFLLANNFQSTAEQSARKGDCHD